MMARMRSFLAVLLAAGLVTLAPAAAHAEKAYYADTGGDVWSHRGGVPTQEVAHTDGDVSSVIVNHRKRTVRMVMSVVTIDADGGSSYRPTLFRFSLVNGRGLVKVFDLNQDNRLRVRPARRRQDTPPPTAAGRTTRSTCTRIASP